MDAAAPEPAHPGLERADSGFRVRFTALGGPCEVLLDLDDPREAAVLGDLAQAEAARIERKFGRYRPEGEVHRIHAASGQPVRVDEETAALLDYAALCHELSGGRFDITSGILRRAWRFDGGGRVPEDSVVRDLLAHVGWSRVRWERPVLALPAGMEIDLGGIGKEYAVDRVAALLRERTGVPLLVNFGGDLFAPGPRRDGSAWAVGIDDPERTGEALAGRVDLERGGLATSGDARRFVLHQGRRLGHLLDPRTGWPVEGAPHSVTVLAATCLEAGTLATLACLMGPGARAFLAEQGVRHRIVDAGAADRTGA